MLVPRKAITEIARLMEDVGPDEIVGFQSGETHLIFTVGGRTLASKKVEAQFPAFEKVVAVTGDKKVVLGREQLLSAVRRVSLLSSERGRAVRLAVETGKLEVSASSPELGEAREAIAVDYAGEGAEIGFNAQYLVEFLQVVGTEQVQLELKDAESQGLLRPVGETTATTATSSCPCDSEACALAWVESLAVRDLPEHPRSRRSSSTRGSTCSMAATPRARRRCSRPSGRWPAAARFAPRTRRA